MQNEVELPLFPFRFHVVDVRDLETEELLASPNPSDNVIAILTRGGAKKEVVRRVLARIARAKQSERKEALAELVTIAGLRRLGDIIGREVKQMPILEDIMDHDLFGPKLRKAHAEGQSQGKSQGQLALLLRMADRKFGRIPAATRKRLESLKPLQLERACLRLLDAKKLEDIFGR